MEAKSSFLGLFERLEGFVGKLPGSLQKPILQEITPLKDLCSCANVRRASC